MKRTVKTVKVNAKLDGKAVKVRMTTDLPIERHNFATRTLEEMNKAVEKIKLDTPKHKIHKVVSQNDGKLMGFAYCRNAYVACGLVARIHNWISSTKV